MTQFLYLCQNELSVDKSILSAREFVFYLQFFPLVKCFVST